jgi:hypothetical protein
MNKKVLMIIVVVLLLLAGGWYFMSSRKTNSPSIPGITGNQESSAKSLKDLLSKGVAQTCTYSNAATTGTIYVSGGKMRGDIDTTVEDVTTKTHMLVMDNTSYIWSGGSKAGFKMSFDPNATPVAGSESSATNDTFDVDADMDYKCKTWIVDSGKFALPAGVTFSEFEVPSQAAPAQGGSSSQCAYCDALTGDDKSQCLTAMKCN